MITMRTKDWKSISGTILVLIAVALVVISAGCSKGPNTANTPTSTSVEDTSMSSTQDSTLMLKLNGTFSGQLSVPASLAEDIKKYFEKSNTTLYSFEVEVVNDNGKPPRRALHCIS
ncbi:hypothetical protein [Thermococcus sp. JCM 11816]|uniref:hypothetical protein n=1 Tax=Thermococcus sp. (strain JCM 11816 / KS-1) TaxID=1295125 RepID=UPI0034662580